MESVVAPFKLPVHSALPNQFLRDEWGNVWFREIIEPNYLVTKLAMIRRHDGADSSVAVFNRGDLGVVMPGDLISVGRCHSDGKIDFILGPKLEDDEVTEWKTDPEKVDIICEDRTFSVSKSLLLRQSEYFRSMFASQFNEALTNGIKKKDVPASTIAAFVEYLEEGTLDCGLADLVRLGHLVHPWEMPRLLRRIELEICSRFDQPETEDDWQDAVHLGAVLKSRWIARAFANRLGSQENTSTSSTS